MKEISDFNLSGYPPTTQLVCRVSFTLMTYTVIVCAGNSIIDSACGTKPSKRFVIRWPSWTRIWARTTQQYDQHLHTSAFPFAHTPVVRGVCGVGSGRAQQPGHGLSPKGRPRGS